MNRLDFNAPIERPPASGFWLGLISLLVGITLIAPPLSVLYDMNDECLRNSSSLHEHGIWATLYEVPPLSVPRYTYFAARTAALVASFNALLLCAIGVLTMRSRALGVKLLGINAVAHVAFMLAMAYTAYRFSIELAEVTTKRAWRLGTPYESTVRATAIWAALPGIAYPLMLLWLFVRQRKGTKRRRLVN